MRARIRLRSESGFSLIEVLVVSVLLIVVIGAVLALSEATQRMAPKEEERAHAIREAQLSLHQMTKELRKAHLVYTVAAQSIDVSVLVKGVDTRVRYRCDIAHPTEASYRRCYRYVVAADGTTSGGTLVIDRVLNAALSPPKAVFTRTGNYVEAKVEVPSRGERKAGYGYEHRIALHDGFYMRNLDA
jgi:competence protein ComGC